MKDAMHFANLAGKALGLTEHQIGGLALIFADAMTDSEQAQHEATWAMAIGAAMAKHREMAAIHERTADTQFGSESEHHKRHNQLALHHRQSAELMRSLPCPPLQKPTRTRN